MQITRSGVLGLAAVFVFGGSSSVSFVAADPPAPAPTSPVTGGVSRSVAPLPSDQKHEAIDLTLRCETPDGKPVVGADVTCFEIDTWTAETRAKANRKTDAAGTCRFDGVAVPLADVGGVLRGRPDLFCCVAIKAAGRASVVRGLGIHGRAPSLRIKGSTVWAKVVMEPAATLHGRVSNIKGEPVEGAVVYKWTQPLSSVAVEGFCCAKTDKNGEYKIADLDPWVRPKDAGRIRVTSREGNLQSGELVSDYFTLHVWHPSYGLKWAQGRKLPGELNVKFPEVGIITGRAIDAKTNRPLAGVPVDAEAQPKGGIEDFHEHYCTNWTTTDSNGTYRLPLRAGNDYLLFSRFEGYVRQQSLPLIQGLQANARTAVKDMTFVRLGVVRAHLIDATTKQRIRFPSKPPVCVLLECEPRWGVNDEPISAEFTEGSAFLMRAAVPDRTYSISVESKDPTISPRRGVIAFNVQPGETVEIDLPVEVKKPRGAIDKKP
ncbi:MAG TPA: hypothetical protein VGP63_18290 [Planctomycetaceae bacterium]|jgi:hypothetical protein|nr:hypothetical protein [Planctomycetaceae bacterium]